MPPSGRPLSLDIDYRTLHRLFWCYLFFIVYASFIPFRFNLDPNFIRWRIDIFLSESLFLRGQRWSGTDVMTNLLVYFPLGALLTGTAYPKYGSMRWPLLPIIVGIVGLLVGFTIEFGQTLSPYRSPSLLDAICNGFGTFVGAALSYRLLPALKGALGTRIERLIRDQPILLMMIFVSLAPILDAFYPFEFKLAIGVFADNLAMGGLTLFFNRWPGVDLLVEKLCAFAAFGYLSAAQRARQGLPFSAAKVLALSAGLAVVVELAKLMVARRTFHADNLIFSLIGAGLGVALERRLPYRNLANRRSLLVLTVLAVALLGYFQLEPFDWISRGELRWKLRQIEWLPFAAYYWSDPRAVLFDLLKKLYLSIPIGLFLSALRVQKDRGPRTQTVAMVALLGLIFEVCQIFIRSRTPSLTDVLIIAIGGWIGALVCRWYQTATALNQPKA
jgi:VanZ family protein